ncbi:hypothetical protein CC80DRAFT_169537 [Byssothecium circinans]|uniref:Uncharacterized protein n=1 Tax=Byssothecium circinans TaxID=147558 RepID=A0A6A5TVK3_9PLEO|nr:hypothetical protein CC80DRAFT_169537 [Byssothecium circinans]
MGEFALSVTPSPFPSPRFSYEQPCFNPHLIFILLTQSSTTMAIGTAQPLQFLSICCGGSQALSRIQLGRAKLLISHHLNHDLFHRLSSLLRRSAALASVTSTSPAVRSTEVQMSDFDAATHRLAPLSFTGQQTVHPDKAELSPDNKKFNI